MTDRRYRVIVVDDHVLVREGLRSILDDTDDLEVVATAGTVDDALSAVERAAPDVLLLDLALGEEDGLDVVRRLRAGGSGVGVLVLSAHDTPQHLREALAAGASGYLVKSSTVEVLAGGVRGIAAGETVIGEEFVPKLLADASHRTASGRPEITDREREVLALVAEGLGNRAIGEQLGIASRTAQKHVENLFRKFAVHDRTQLVTKAFRAGLIG